MLAVVNLLNSFKSLNHLPIQGNWLYNCREKTSLNDINEPVDHINTKPAGTGEMETTSHETIPVWMGSPRAG